VGLGRRDLTIVQDEMSAKTPNMIGGVGLRERPFAQAKKNKKTFVESHDTWDLRHERLIHGEPRTHGDVLANDRPRSKSLLGSPGRLPAQSTSA
jgi:hypothetical protein